MPMPIDTGDRPSPGPLGVKYLQRPQHRHAGCQGIVGRAVEQRHDRVADVAVDEASVGEDGRFHVPDVGIDEIDARARAQAADERREAADVGEQHRQRLRGVIAKLHVLDVLAAERGQELMGDKAGVRASQRDLRLERPLQVLNERGVLDRNGRLRGNDLQELDPVRRERAGDQVVFEQDGAHQFAVPQHGRAQHRTRTGGGHVRDRGGRSGLARCRQSPPRGGCAGPTAAAPRNTLLRRAAGRPAHRPRRDRRARSRAPASRHRAMRPGRPAWHRHWPATGGTARGRPPGSRSFRRRLAPRGSWRARRAPRRRPSRPRWSAHRGTEALWTHARSPGCASSS